MKKFLFVFIKFFVLGLVLTSCVNFAGGNYSLEINLDDDYAEIYSSSRNDLANKKQTFEKKKNVYQNLVGTKWLLRSNFQDSNFPYSTIVFHNDYIIFDNIQYPVDLNENVFVPNEVGEDTKKLNSHIYFNLDSKIIGFETVSYSYSQNYGILKFYDNNKIVSGTYTKE